LRKTYPSYFQVVRNNGYEVLSAEFLFPIEAVNWAEHLERRGWGGVAIYEVRRDQE
jgi:hypothetical protein